MPAGIARTRYILGKLTHRPAYYIWFNPLMMVEDGLLISDAQPISLPVMHLMPQSDHSVSEVSTP
jgi:hypothetical protein